MFCLNAKARWRELPWLPSGWQKSRDPASVWIICPPLYRKIIPVRSSYRVYRCIYTITRGHHGFFSKRNRYLSWRAKFCFQFFDILVNNNFNRRVGRNAIFSFAEWYLHSANRRSVYCRPVFIQGRNPGCLLDETHMKLFYNINTCQEYLFMRPDFAHKQFGDKRTAYVLLVLALAEDCPFVRSA
jgi:hypothetical protein